MTDTSSDRAWRRWGKVDPYFGVLTGDKYRAVNIDAHRDEFFASGERDIDAHLSTVEQQYGKLERNLALDFGCGVGRLILPLARRFEKVVGVDISMDMINEARANSINHGTVNVEYVLSDDELRRVEGAFDFVHSFIVLQHIPVARGLQLIDRLLALVAGSGAAYIQIPVSRSDNSFDGLLYWARKNVAGVFMLEKLLRGRPFGEPMMQMNAYPLVDVLERFVAHGMSPVCVEIETISKLKHARIYARKA